MSSTLLLDDGDVTPGVKSSSYYAEDVIHQFVRIVHDNLLPDGTGGLCNIWVYKDTHGIVSEQRKTMIPQSLCFRPTR
jgi:hypothetical protein